MNKFLLFAGLVLVMTACSTSEKKELSNQENNETSNQTAQVKKVDEPIVDKGSVTKTLPLTQPGIKTNAGNLKSNANRFPEESVCPVKGTRLDKNAVQTFAVQASRDTLLTLTGGTKILVPANSFAYKDSVNVSPKSVSLLIHEFMALPQFIEAGLMTSTIDNKVIETAGSLYVQAISNNTDTCILKSGKVLEMAFPVKGERKKDMRLFNGKVGDDGFVDWKVDELLTVRDSVACYKDVGTRYEQFQDGNISLEEYYVKNVKLNPVSIPRIEYDNVFINFDVVEGGKIREIKVTGSENPLIDAKLETATRWMPQWKAFKRVERVENGITKWKDYTVGIMVKLFVDVRHGRILLDTNNDTHTSGIVKHVEAKKYYIMQTRQLGWLNCDRFLGTNISPIDVFVQRDSKKENSFMVLRDIRSVVRGENINGGVLFKGLGEGEFAYMVNAKKKGERYLVEIQPYVCGKGADGPKTEQWLTRDEMEMKIKSLWARAD